MTSTVRTGQSHRRRPGRNQRGTTAPFLAYPCLAVVGAGIYIGEQVAPTIGLQITAAAILLFVATNTGVASLIVSPRLYPLLAVLLIGSVGAAWEIFAHQRDFNIDVQRDVLIVLTHVMILGFCYYLAANNQADKALVSLWVFGVFTSALHLVNVAMTLGDGLDSTLEQFRLDAGKGSLAEITGLIALLVLRASPFTGLAALSRQRLYFIASMSVILTSATLSLSRTMLLALLVCALSFAGLRYSTHSNRLVVFPAGVLRVAAYTIGLTLGLLTLIAWTAPSAYQFLDHYFISKIINSVGEVSSTTAADRLSASRDYRSFESTTALRLYDRWGAWRAVFGGGFGTPVEFGFNTASSTASFTRYYAPFFHNGYLYFLIKAGFIGLILYLVQISIFLHSALGRFTAQGMQALFAVAAHKALVSISVVLALGTVATGGFGFPEGYLPVAACIGVCWGLSNTFAESLSGPTSRPARYR